MHSRAERFLPIGKLFPSRSFALFSGEPQVQVFAYGFPYSVDRLFSAGISPRANRTRVLAFTYNKKHVNVSL